MSDEGKDPVKLTGQAASALSELVKLAGDSPEGKQAGKNLGKSAVVITDAIHNCLLPIAALNFGIQKAREYFQNKFAEDLAPLTATIPSENVVEPKASLAGPALQGLAFSHEEDDLKKMYLNLIAGAMDTRVAHKAHPAYVEVIKQLTSYEASVFEKLVRRPEGGYPLVKLQKSISADVMRVYENVIEWGRIDPPAGNPTDVNINMMDNWIRLGLISVTFTAWFTSKEAYKWAEQTIPYKLLLGSDPPGPPTVVNGAMSITNFGRCFAEAVGIRPRPTAVVITVGPDNDRP